VLIRFQQAFRRGKLPVSLGGLGLAKESVHATDEEIDFIESLVGDTADFTIR